MNQGEISSTILRKFKLTQTKLGEIMGYDQSDISKLTISEKIGDSYSWKFVCNLSINPRWLEYGEEPMILDYESLKTA